MTRFTPPPKESRTDVNIEYRGEKIISLIVFRDKSPPKTGLTNSTFYQFLRTLGLIQVLLKVLLGKEGQIGYVCIHNLSTSETIPSLSELIVYIFACVLLHICYVDIC